jgi:hypothetical protein
VEKNISQASTPTPKPVLITFIDVNTVQDFSIWLILTFKAMGCTQTVQYRNKETGKIVSENRSEGVCIDCTLDIIRRQQG